MFFDLAGSTALSSKLDTRDLQNAKAILQSLPAQRAS